MVFILWSALVNIDSLAEKSQVLILASGSLAIAGEGATHSHENGETVTLLCACNRASIEDIAGRVELLARQTGSPMTYMHDRKQYIVLGISHTGANARSESCGVMLP